MFSGCLATPEKFSHICYFSHPPVDILDHIAFDPTHHNHHNTHHHLLVARQGGCNFKAMGHLRQKLW